jgi:VanZ family protein
MMAGGMFVPRMLAFTGCSFEVRQCVLPARDARLYDAAVDFWEELLHGIEKVVELVGKDPSNLFRL